jgi:protein-tyrosine phosphatase
VRLLNKVVSQFGKSIDAPVVVHCSAGCGRTGVFCRVDGVINSTDMNDDQDMGYQSVLGIREQRMSLVQTIRQYVLCYDCVLQYVINRITSEDNKMKIE